MASRRVVVNGIVYEVEDSERAKPRGAGAVARKKCPCRGNGCEAIAIEYPCTGFVVRNTDKHRVRVGMQMLSGWDCGRWSHFDLDPGESRTYPTGSYGCPYEVTRF